jgi:hypothetical protein
LRQDLAMIFFRSSRWPGGLVADRAGTDLAPFDRQVPTTTSTRPV